MAYSQLKKIRDIFGLNQSDMGKLLDLPQGTYSNYERGRTEIPTDILKSLSRYGVSIEWIYGGVVNKAVCEKILATIQTYSPTKKTRAFAEALGVPEKFIRAIIDGEIAPSNEFIMKIASTFGLNQYELLTGVYPHVPPMQTTGDTKADYDALKAQAMSENRQKINNMLDEYPDMEPQIVEVLEGAVKMRAAMNKISSP